ncbi:MAG: hypothetical protein JWQ21_2951 [Herminiimonas sp.]|nr:hypothetical protein [Herminiimonas sp.]
MDFAIPIETADCFAASKRFSHLPSALSAGLRLTFNWQPVGRLDLGVSKSGSRTLRKPISDVIEGSSRFIVTWRRSGLGKVKN